MEPLDEFARRQILETKRERVPIPRPAGCKLVTAVSPAGVAAQAGVAPRDLLVEMNGEAAATLVDLEYYGAAEKTFVFYRRASHERVTLRTTGIDPGILLEPTPDAIKATFDPKDPDYPALVTLWRARDFAAVATLAEATLAATRSRATPALALAAAAAVETGRVQEGGAWAAEYLGEHADKWTMNFTAIAFHARGVAKWAAGERDDAIGLWQTAWDYEPHERTAQALEKATGARPPKAEPYWPGRAFPLDYRLPLLESPQPGGTSLAEALGQVTAGGVLLVCLLCNYRVNGPYSRFMFRWAAWAPHFGPRLAGLHVISEERQRPEGRDSLFKAEARALAAGRPVTLLFDEPGELAFAVKPAGSPHVLALDRRGTVVSEGELDGVELWSTLAQVDGAA